MKTSKGEEKMKAIRKALALALSLIMVLGLAACGSGGEDTPVATTAPSAQAEGGILTDEEAIYMNAMSDFYDAYMAAFEAETLSERWPLPRPSSSKAALPPRCTLRAAATP